MEGRESVATEVREFVATEVRESVATEVRESVATEARGSVATEVGDVTNEAAERTELLPFLPGTFCNVDHAG